MRVLTFLKVDFQKGAWKQVYAEGGRITYKSTQNHASLEVVQADEGHKVGFRAMKGTKVLISGNSIHLPESLV